LAGRDGKTSARQLLEHNLLGRQISAATGSQSRGRCRGIQHRGSNLTLRSNQACVGAPCARIRRWISDSSLD
jgi:hypothetical protein